MGHHAIKMFCHFCGIMHAMHTLHRAAMHALMHSYLHSFMHAFICIAQACHRLHTDANGNYAKHHQAFCFVTQQGDWTGRFLRVHGIPFGFYIGFSAALLTLNRGALHQVCVAPLMHGATLTAKFVANMCAR